MAARSRSTPSLTVPAQAQLPVSLTPEPVPTFPHVVTGSPPTVEERQHDTPFKWITSLRLKTIHAVLEIMGYRARRDLALESWAFMRFIVSWLLALAQIVAIILTTAVAATHPSPRNNPHFPPRFPAPTELNACSSLASLNIVWLIKLAVQSCADSWFLLRRWQLGREPVQGPPELCPPNYAAVMSLVSFCEFGFVLVWILLEAIKLALHGEQCLTDAPRISIVAFTITGLAVVYYLPTSLRLLTHRWQERQPDNFHDIEIGPLPQSKADRIPLVYYIPHPPPPAARPAGPVARFPRSIGQVLGRQGATADLKRGARGAGCFNNSDDWDKTFQPMSHRFLRLDKRDAQCAICLDDYMEPPRVSPGTMGAVTTGMPQSVSPDTQGAPHPLRWLYCGHTFHKHCIDPYITREAAKCPTCRAPIQPLARR